MMLRRQKKSREVVPPTEVKANPVIFFNEPIKTGNSLSFKSKEDGTISINQINTIFDRIPSERKEFAQNIINKEGPDVEFMTEIANSGNENLKNNVIRYMSRRDEVADNALIMGFFKQVFDATYSILYSGPCQVLSTIFDEYIGPDRLISIEHVESVARPFMYADYDEYANGGGDICKTYEFLYNIKNNILLLISNQVYTLCREIIYSKGINSFRSNLYSLFESPGKAEKELIESISIDSIYLMMQNCIDEYLIKLDEALKTIITYYLFNIKGTFSEYNDPKFIDIMK